MEGGDMQFEGENDGGLVQQPPLLALGENTIGALDFGDEGMQYFDSRVVKTVRNLKRIK
jgi:hypothetical protein